MAEKIVHVGDVDIWSEALGEPGAPPLLLIMGANASAMGWPDEFVELLVQGGHRVIRYDHRDTGRSTHIPPADATYEMADLARDALAVLDAHDVRSAHVMGMSMGGLIGQLLAVDHADRLRSLTLALTGALDMGTVDDTPPDAERLEAMLALSTPGGDHESEVDRRVALWRALHGTVLPFDEAEYRRLEERVIAHAGTFLPATGHIRLASIPLERGGDDLRGLITPTLIIQGTEDPFYPTGYGRYLAQLIPGAVLELIDGLGHSLPRAVHKKVTDLVLAHTRQHVA
ncbi:hydrolase [Longimycelium tulufanense]|uniref:Hydrolase n=1 Tax=Longimycelium tulufanense TaxID=907463 RepID=A0A8J3FWG7_9PSEU|nr:alpha/beta fold hydrolase [Longimycelium tulufanense]GGM66239.1 hydrolase [Longimycelium tulufanense]